MTKEQMQQTIIQVDKRGQKKKRSRIISYMIFFAVCSFIFFRLFYPKQIWEDILSSIILGPILGFIIPMVIVFYCSMEDIQISYPEDRDLKEWLKAYSEKFGEEFYGPWSY